MLVGRKHVSVVPVHGTVRVAIEIFTFAVTREGLKPELFNEFGENSLIGGNPLSTDFKECAVNMIVPCAPAYTFTRFKDCNGMSCLLQSVCCSESGRTCADNTTSRVSSFVVSFLAVMVKPFRSKKHKTNCVRFSVSQNTEITNLGAFMKRKISDGMFYNCSQTGRQYTPKAKK